MPSAKIRNGRGFQGGDSAKARPEVFELERFHRNLPLLYSGKHFGPAVSVLH